MARGNQNALLNPDVRFSPGSATGFAFRWRSQRKLLSKGFLTIFSMPACNYVVAYENAFPGHQNGGII